VNDSLLITVAGVIGLLMGALYGISGFGEPGKTDDFAKDRRVKSLIWLVGGAVGTFAVDWNLMSPGGLTPAQRGLLTGTYMLAAVVTALAVILLIAFSIYLTVHARGRDKPFFRGRAGELVLEFVYFGYRYYRAKLDQLDKEAANASDSAVSLGALGVALSTVMMTAALERAQPNIDQRERFIDEVMSAIENTVKLFGGGVPGLELRTNYMVKVGQDGLAGHTPMFVEGALQRYDGFLVLRRYRDGMVAAVCVPLERDALSTTLLPGAPTSVAEHAACLLNPKKLSFRKGVPKGVQADVRAYFKDAPYASVLSVPLIWGRDVVGVVNIESNHVEIVGKGPDMIKRIGHALAPYSVILGELVHRAEEI
jgi:hypothetical protein